MLYTTLKDLLVSNKRIILYEMNDYPGSTLMFNILNRPSAYVASELDKMDICVRSGFHCSPLAHKQLKTGDGGAIRVSFSVYNTIKDIYSLYDALLSLTKK